MLYFDYNASTPIAPAVQAAMAPFVAGHYGNPSSGHWAGAPAARAVACARTQIADLLGCSPAEVLFTSGGTESNNTALLGAFWAAGEGRRRGSVLLVGNPALPLKGFDVALRALSLVEREHPIEVRGA